MRVCLCVCVCVCEGVCVGDVGGVGGRGRGLVMDLILRHGYLQVRPGLPHSSVLQL